MTKIRATAKCPLCKWNLTKYFESSQEVLDLVHKANETIDPMLIGHMKNHKSISDLLSEAAKELPISQEPHNGFRGSFDLKYQEVR